MVASFSISARFTANFEFVFFPNTGFRGFILKTTERAYVILKNVTRNF